MYFMVEVRKIIDHSKSAKSFPLLKFYADWSVHTEKDRITPEIKAMSEEMYTAIAAEIADPYYARSHDKSPVVAFAYMEGLAREIETFLRDNGLDNPITTQKDNWVSFVSLLVKILEDQPIKKPSQNVKEIVFEPTSVRFLVVCRIAFEQPIKGHDQKDYDHYILKNVYQ